MKRMISIVILCVPLAAAASTPTPVYAPATAAAATQAASETPPELLEAWPKPKGSEKKRIDTDVLRLRKAHTDEMAEQAQAALSAASAAVVPPLLKAFDKEKDDKARERVAVVLEHVTHPPQAKLLADEFTHKSARVRAWVLWRTATFRDMRVAPQAEAALEAARKRAAKSAGKATEKADKRELYCAALCAAATGSSGGLDVLYETAVKSWGDYGAEMRHALESLRSSDAQEQITSKLQHAEERDAKAAALRMLAGCGNEDSIPAVGRYLDAADSSLRTAAINALRGIVDGDPPLERLPVFEAIELANKWKERL